jgi:non-specific serine/threonine protein kinase
VDKSLVMGDERDGHTRYRMLETIREYGQEKLELAGESAASKARHCEHYFAVAKLASKRMRTAEQAEGVRRLESELDNLRASIAVALAGGVDPFISVKLAVALMPFWIARGYLIEGRGHVEAALALPAVQGSDLALAHALYVGAALAGCQGDHAEARRALEKCLALRRGLGTPVDIAATLSSLAEMLIQSGNVEEARIAEEEALQIFRGLGDRQGEVIGLLHLGSVFSLLVDEAQARQYLEQGIVSAHEWGFPEVEAECELGIGQIALDRDRPDEAVARFTRAVDIQRHAADKRGEATALWWLGRIDLAAGCAESARIRLGGARLPFVRDERRARRMPRRSRSARPYRGGARRGSAPERGGSRGARPERTSAAAPRGETLAA